jgi:hypothetical protein
VSLLNELGLKYRTDKAVDGKRGEPGKGHDYLRVYERFSKLERTQVRKVLEIGVQKGASIRMWAEYFPNATVFGLDIAESALKVTGDRIKIQLLDQSDAAALGTFARENGPFDLIVEDGSHIWSHQIIGMQTLIPHLAAGGHYIVEDLHTSYSAEFGQAGGVTGVQYVLRCCEKIVGGNRVSSTDGSDLLLPVLDKKIDSLMVLRYAAVFFAK